MKKLIFLLIMVTTSSCFLLKMWPDSFVEEGIEDVIENSTGIKIDFTGDSKEG